MSLVKRGNFKGENWRLVGYRTGLSSTSEVGANAIIHDMVASLSLSCNIYFVQLLQDRLVFPLMAIDKPSKERMKRWKSWFRNDVYGAPLRTMTDWSSSIHRTMLPTTGSWQYFRMMEREGDTIAQVTLLTIEWLSISLIKDHHLFTAEGPDRPLLHCFPFVLSLTCIWTG